MHFKIVNRTKAGLRGMTTPKSVDGGNLEAIPFVLFDTQLYTSAVDTRLNFFTAVQNDPTMGNMTSGGSLAVDEWMEIEWICIDPIVPDGAFNTGAIGSWADMGALMYESRMTHLLKIQSKDYGQLPATYFGASGGVTGFGYNEAAVGTIHHQYANWGNFSGGFWVGGQIIIPPQAGFSARLDVNAAVTLPSGSNINIRVGYLGTLHRPIL